MKVVSLRQVRVGDLIAKSIAELLQRKIKDPRLEGVTITGAQVSMDMRVGQVFFCVLDRDRKEGAQAGLDSAAGYMRRELGRMLRLKHVPSLRFSYDASFDYGARIDELLENITDHTHDE
ncbi:MAG TPA: 30S ribosome-binding factor RbfA [Deltaproteobacteria bacterium]|nr:30S ribosome-binding factor RbfA [Deltaproteobacteria bacterium]